MTVRILVGDCREVLKTLPDESVHCVVTSPPYYGLRSYGVLPVIWDAVDGCKHEWGETIPGDPRGGSGANAKECYGGQDGTSTYARQVPRGNYCLHCGAWRGCLGNEPTIEMFISYLVGIFRECRRVLRRDGTMWVVIGDSYAGNNAGSFRPGAGRADGRVDGRGQRDRNGNSCPNGLKPKDLCMIPARMALALQADGWWLRADIIWSKPNPMPESVTDRPTKSHEYVFMFSRSARYFWDREAVREALKIGADHDRPVATDGKGQSSKMESFQHVMQSNPAGRNIRSVWEVATEPLSLPHYAAFPTALVEPMIKAGTSQHGICGKCSAPWQRTTAKPEGYPIGSYHDHEKDGIEYGLRQKGKGPITLPPGMHPFTTGWRAGCDCNADVVPATILDPFSGAGTTLLVANRLGRDAIGIELNPEYAAMSEKRIAEDAGPMFETVTVETPQQAVMW